MAAKCMDDLRTREDVKEHCIKEMALIPFLPMLLDHIRRIMSSVPRTKEDLTKAAKQKFAEVTQAKLFRLERCPKPLCNCRKEREDEINKELNRINEFADKEPAAAFSLAVMAEVNMHLCFAVRPLAKCVEDMAIHLHFAATEFLDGDENYVDKNNRFQWQARPEGSNPDLSHMIRDAFLVPAEAFEVQFVPPAVLHDKMDRAKASEKAKSMLQEMLGKALNK